MPNSFSSGFLEAEPEMRVLPLVIFWLGLSRQGNKGKEWVGGRGAKLSKNIALAGDQLQYGSHWDTLEHTLHHLQVKELTCAHLSSAKVC